MKKKRHKSSKQERALGMLLSGKEVFKKKTFHIRKGHFIIIKRSMGRCNKIEYILPCTWSIFLEEGI